MIFTFQINKCFVFQKTLKEVERFCKDIVNEIKNPMIESMSELFNFCYVLGEVLDSQNESRLTS